MGTSPQQFQVKPKQVDIAWDWNKMMNSTFNKNPGGLLTLLYKKKKLQKCLNGDEASLLK